MFTGKSTVYLQLNQLSLRSYIYSIFTVTTTVSKQYHLQWLFSVHSYIKSFTAIEFLQIHVQCLNSPIFTVTLTIRVILQLQLKYIYS